MRRRRLQHCGSCPTTLALLTQPVVKPGKHASACSGARSGARVYSRRGDCTTMQAFAHTREHERAPREGCLPIIRKMVAQHNPGIASARRWMATVLARAGALDRRRGRTEDVSDGREREDDANSGQQQRACTRAHTQRVRMRLEVCLTRVRTAERKRAPAHVSISPQPPTGGGGGGG